MLTYSYSFDEENYFGSFITPEEAVADAFHGNSTRARVFVGVNVPPTQPEDLWEASDWLEHVSCQDEYSVDAAEGWDCSTKEQRRELEKEVSAVMAAWLDRHKLRPKFFTVEDVKEYHRETKPEAKP